MCKKIISLHNYIKSCVQMNKIYFKKIVNILILISILRYN